MKLLDLWLRHRMMVQNTLSAGSSEAHRMARLAQTHRIFHTDCIIRYHHICTLALWGLWKTRGWIISRGRLMSIALPNFMAPSLPLTDSLVCVTWNKSNWVNKAWCKTFSLTEMEFFANVHKKEIWVARPHHVTKSGALKKHSFDIYGYPHLQQSRYFMIHQIQ